MEQRLVIRIILVSSTVLFQRELYRIFIYPLTKGLWLKVAYERWTSFWERRIFGIYFPLVVVLFNWFKGHYKAIAREEWLYWVIVVPTLRLLTLEGDLGD